MKAPVKTGSNHVIADLGIREEAFVFRQATWDMRGNLVPLNPEPDTWQDCRKTRSAILAMYCCPQCHKVSAIHRKYHFVDHFGHVVTKDRPPKPLACGHQCGFRRDCYLDRWSDKPLYCAVILRSRDGVAFYRRDFRYCHGANEAEARSHILLRDRDQIVAIGLAIGYYVTDERSMAGNLDDAPANKEIGQ